MVYVWNVVFHRIENGQRQMWRCRQQSIRPLIEIVAEKPKPNHHKYAKHETHVAANELINFIYLLIWNGGTFGRFDDDFRFLF